MRQGFLPSGASFPKVSECACALRGPRSRAPPCRWSGPAAAFLTSGDMYPWLSLDGPPVPPWPAARWRPSLLLALRSPSGWRESRCIPVVIPSPLCRWSGSVAFLPPSALPPRRSAGVPVRFAVPGPPGPPGSSMAFTGWSAVALPVCAPMAFTRLLALPLPEDQWMCRCASRSPVPGRHCRWLGSETAFRPAAVACESPGAAMACSSVAALLPSGASLPEGLAGVRVHSCVPRPSLPMVGSGGHLPACGRRWQVASSHFCLRSDGVPPFLLRFLPEDR
jgi:hypothetical protein